MTAITVTLQAFFTDRLIQQRQASPHTIAAYRDTLRLLLTFAATQAGLPFSRLDFADLQAPVIAAFLDHLEHARGNTVRTRNARLAAIHSLFGFAALRHPEHAADIGRVLAIPAKRSDHTIVTFLTDAETEALLAAPDRGTRTGRRDHTLFLLATQTGLRASELTSLTRGHLHLETGAHVSCHGKGRKDRITPLTNTTVTALRVWLAEQPSPSGNPLFPTNHGGSMSADALQQRLTLHSATAALTCPTLAAKNVTPHVLRHTAAMRLLRAGVDVTVIALWLGHENVNTTQIYLQGGVVLARARSFSSRSARHNQRPSRKAARGSGAW
ncbi:MAG: integrase [Amycolatopsis sp.]|uniref:tyrosine-type recombinase/integrase n=1 Tax=Amycolatopsis sp. TaxID=37632 RepID=UPI002609B5E0|nr:tyrosine-type recombinase/integrase [Amycolatopsis sp.]MCU1684505.1 integrase [Amycolatopsis sp.]